MTYLSVCSGIEAATVAWHPLGWEPVGFAEIDAFPSAVLAHHYPTVKNYGDFTRIDAIAPDLLVGGTPCQAFSVAGKRAGLDDPRGNLTLEFVRLAERLRPRWLVWENVPGVLSIDGGRTFGAFLWLLGECGYGFAYRVLDAQYFGVPQRRRRVFVVGHLGNWRPAAAVLFERHCLSGYPSPRRKAGERTAPTLGAGPVSGGRTYGTDADSADSLIPAVSMCLNAGGMGRIDGESETFIAFTNQSGASDSMASTLKSGCHGALPMIAHSLRGDGFDASEDGTGRGTPLVPIGFYANDSGSDAGDDLAPTLRSMEGGGGNHPAVAFRACGQDGFTPSGVAPPITSTDGGGAGAPSIQSGVRRLTPREAERLQGFKDDYTLVPYRGKPAADGPRYKALGNSMAVPCMRWIGERIAAVEATL